MMQNLFSEPNFFANAVVQYEESKNTMDSELTNYERRNNRRLLIWFLIALSIAVIPWLVVGAAV